MTSGAGAGYTIAADGSMHPSGPPVVTHGARGVASFEPRARTAARDLHSGDFGRVVPNAIWSLVQLLATLRDADGTIAIEGLHGGYGGPGSQTVLPCAAVAKCDIRLVDGMTPADALAEVAAHVRRHAPDVQFVPTDGILPLKTAMDLPFGDAISAATRQARGAGPLVYSCPGGSLPDDASTKILGVPAYVVPYANADESNHAPNENLRLDRFHDGIRTGAAMLTRLDALED